MKTGTFSLALGLLLVSFATIPAPLGAQELKFATPAQAPFWDILPQVAEEKGLWKEAGLPAHWTRFRTGPDMYRAVLGGHIDMGTTAATGVIQVNSRLPAPIMIIVADGGGKHDFSVWVRANSPIKSPRDLRGQKIGVFALATTIHVYGLVVVKALGIEKEVKFVGLGGVRERLAAMKAGVVEATIGSYDATVDLVYKGEVRELLDVMEHLPKEWIDRALFVRLAFGEKSPDMVKRGIKVLLAAADYLQSNPHWIGEFMKKEYGYSAPAAEAVQRKLLLHPYKEKGKIDRKGIENAVNFLAEYDLAPREKMPVDKQFTNAFIP